MSDKRKVSTDALETLGTIITTNEKRDAIHLAVEPVVATQKLFPGQDVGLVEGGAGVCDKPLGIVDPFLKSPVYPGQHFWLVIYPRQIQSLRHVWTHPDFPEESSKTRIDESKEWLTALADSISVTYEELLAAAENFIDEDEYLIGGGEMEGEVTPPEFWDHYQIVTGKIIPKEKQDNFFSCSC
jgi:hypothetical protein